MSATGEGGELETARGREIDSRGPSTANYEFAAEVGFDLFPEVVRSRLYLEGVIDTEPISASCNELEVRRRQDGSYYQFGTGWWGDESRVLSVECKREMKQLGDKKFAPSGEWSVAGVIHHLGGSSGREISTWSFDSGGPVRSGSSRRVVAEDPLDLLPPDVVAPVRGGLSDLWRISSTTSADEFLCAIKWVDDEVLLLGATRTARTKAALHKAEWVVTTLVAPLEREESFSFVCGEQANSLRGFGQVAKPASTHPLTSG